MPLYQNILVPTDFSPTAEQATSLAIDLARKFDARLLLLHVYELPPVYGYGARVAWPVEQYEREARKALDTALRGVTERYPAAEALLYTGRASERIVAVAVDRKVDLIVMGTHGHRGFARAFFGSVAEAIVRRSPVPVLTVGPRHDRPLEAPAPSV